MLKSKDNMLFYLLGTIVLQTWAIFVDFGGLCQASKGHGSALQRELPWPFDKALLKKEMSNKGSEK